ncbi:hypothetical protein [Pseudolabrys sp. FHR47]|uniref:hypothetical protein n=1 Tax=Pseudolabrys sp. FHR47 TaxID=2562284 RepID=UPI0010BF170F|nr:hypothetical protein [Pseudolabrys sp. FHR47]
MKKLSTALLAGAFALTTATAFAQVGVNAGTSTSGGAAVSGTKGSGSLGTSTDAGANVGGTKANVGVDASGNAAAKKRGTTTTGSGAAGVGASGTVK